MRDATRNSLREGRRTLHHYSLAIIAGLSLCLAATLSPHLSAHDEDYVSPCDNGGPFGIGITGSPDQIGEWGPVLTDGWPAQATHAGLLPSGKVLWWRGASRTHATTATYLWDPDSDVTQQLDVYLANHFCAGLTALPDGRLLTQGGTERKPGFFGTRYTSIFDPVLESWSPQPTSPLLGWTDTAFGRWYPTLTTLPDGRILAISGQTTPRDNNTFPTTPTTVAEIPETYDPRTDTWTKLPGAQLRLPLYPYDFVLPDGRIFYSGPGTTAQALDVATETWEVVAASNFSWTGGSGSSAVMYRPGKVLRTGARDNVTIRIDRAEVIDMTQASPQWRAIDAPMSFERRRADLVLLPDGTVLVVGGAVAGQSSHECAVHAPELWDPDTEAWTLLAPMARPRIYHSTALLLPDGRVLAAGGENIDGQEKNAEVFSPPYLFKGTRPVVDSAPGTVSYAQTFNVSTKDYRSIASVALLRPGAATHNFDQNQRYVPLTFTNKRRNRLVVDAPADANHAPPGPYMVFVVNDQGVPSVAHFVQVGPTEPQGDLCNNNFRCDPGEDCNSCPNDCISGGGPVCGNGVCEAWGGEDCVSCQSDCNGKQGGKKKARFCCGDGDGQNPAPCSDSRCTELNYICEDTAPPLDSFCCGDGVCESDEDLFDCRVDCATSNFLQVTDVDVTCVDLSKGKVTAKAVVTVRERDTGFPAFLAGVWGEWGGATSGESSGLTNAAGQVQLDAPVVFTTPATFSFIVTDAQDGLASYDRRAGIELKEVEPGKFEYRNTIEDTVTCGLTCNNNGICEPTELCTVCPTDCTSGSGSCCGNLVCEAGEDVINCDLDCALE